MALKNWQVLASDPRETALPNDGVTEVGRPQNDEEWDVLRYELGNFVCEGQYEEGLSHILETYLSNLDRPTQPAVWLSGFYGSGKSHLARVLEYVWQDVQLPDGASARSIVHLTPDIEVLLKELSTAGRREGGLWAASGKLGSGAGNSVRLAILGILFKAAGLPEDYKKARFVLWLKQEGIHDAVVEHLRSQGRELPREMLHLYASTPLADAVLSARPSFAESNSQARDHFRANFAEVPDVSNEELLAIMEEVVRYVTGAEGDFPCTLIVLDELQQYLTDNPGQTLEFQNVVEACSRRFKSHLLLVATGQSALLGHPEMSKLKDRFTVPIALGDSDVERVLRQVVLRKNPQHVKDLQDVLSESSGEIDRQLLGTKLEPRTADREVLIADYPLLPTRRRFWESVLRAVDRAGAAGQLRTQLRTVYEATKHVAEDPIGVVVAGDFIYQQQSRAMVESGVLLRDIAESIEGLDDGTESGRLRARACALVFLIQQLSTEAGADTGTRPTATMIADLMVQDLKKDGSRLREALPKALEGLTEDGLLMRLDSGSEPEYRLQTRESMEWEGNYRTSRTRYAADAATIADYRNSELRKRVDQEIGKLQVQQGQTNEPRKLALEFGSEAPGPSTSIPIWVRNGGDVQEKTVRQDAQAAGIDSATVFVFLPSASSAELRDGIAGFLAAEDVLTKRGPGSYATPEAAQARAAMEARRGQHKRDVDAILNRITEGARVFQGGGTEVVSNEGLRSAVQEAAAKAVDRLYRNFDVADHRKWSQVFDRARDGNPDPLEVLGYSGDVKDHPVCVEILKFIGNGRRGSEIRRNFEDHPYGWPRDAINGALLALLTADQITARLNGEMVVAKQLDATKITKADFRSQTVVIGASQRIAIRTVIGEAGVSATSGQELQSAQAWLQRMTELGKSASGEPPAPAPRDQNLLNDIESKAGNEQLQLIYEHRQVLIKLAQDLQRDGKRIEERLPRWHAFKELLFQAERLPRYGTIVEQSAAIESDRLLLQEPDPVHPLLAEVVEALRAEAQKAHDGLKQRYEKGLRELNDGEAWQRLTDDKAADIMLENKLKRPEVPATGTEQELLQALKRRSLSELEAQTEVLGARFEKALQDAIKLKEPRTRLVTVPRRVFHEKTDVDKFLDELRKELMRHVDEGHPVSIT